MKYNYRSNCFENPCMQVNTSMTNIFNSKLDVPSSTPVFSDDVVHIYRDFDVLMSSYDPQEISTLKELQSLNEKYTQINSEQKSDNV